MDGGDRWPRECPIGRALARRDGRCKFAAPGMRSAKAGALVAHVSERMIYYAARVQRSGRQDLIDAIRRGEMTVHAALRIIDGPKPIDRYAALLKAWNAASDDDRQRLLIAAAVWGRSGQAV